VKIKLSTLAALLLGFILIRCAIVPPPPLPVSKPGPLVRIGIAENLKSLSFETNDYVDILDQDDQFLARGILGTSWQVSLAEPVAVNLLYRLLYREVDSRDEAQRLAASLEARGYSAVIKSVRKREFLESDFGYRSYSQVLLSPIFSSEAEAKQYQQSLGNQVETTILPFFDSKPQGTIILYNEDTGRQFQAPGFIRVRGKLFTVKVLVGKGYHFEREEVRTYRGELEFWIDRFGGLTLVNEIPLEIYLAGVVGSEMNTKFPLEALKSQAIAARTYTLARIGKQHRLSPFDLCDEVHCHVYGGVEHESERTIAAVDGTAGLVLMYRDQICDTYYAGVCGGHTESNQNVWFTDPQPYLAGHLDSQLADRFPAGYLQDESRVRQWIESSPDVYCNTTRTPVPDYLDYTKKYFRWTVRYSAERLSQIIADKTGKHVGLVQNLVPLERGVSGRIMRLEVQGSRQSIIITKELDIRKALSPNYLYSSCFVVDRQGNDFILKGAGWGHGVGMCQTGAAMMALKGFNYRDILTHYYQNASIRKLY